MSQASARQAAHAEPHGGGMATRLNWLRAAVLGANDGIVSTAGLVVGVAGATSSRTAILTAGLAGLFAGALAMASGEHVSVSSQRDSERSMLALERRELAESPQAEVAELARIYVSKGLQPGLARHVAERLTASDPLAAHAEAELGIDPEQLAHPGRDRHGRDLWHRHADRSRRHLTRPSSARREARGQLGSPLPGPVGLVGLEPVLLGHQEALRLRGHIETVCAQQPGHPLRCPAGQRRGPVYPGIEGSRLDRVLAEGAEPLAQPRAQRVRLDRQAAHRLVRGLDSRLASDGPGHAMSMRRPADHDQVGIGQSRLAHL